jgi:hypothetical protein
VGAYVRVQTNRPTFLSFSCSLPLPSLPPPPLSSSATFSDQHQHWHQHLGESKQFKLARMEASEEREKG